MWAALELGDLVASPLHWPVPQPMLGATPAPDIPMQQARRGPGMCISRVFPVGGDPAAGGTSPWRGRGGGRELGKEVRRMGRPSRPRAGTSR